MQTNCILAGRLFLVDNLTAYGKSTPMICPHCKKDIPDSAVAKHLAAKGGKAGKRTITPDQQKKMQAAKKAKLETT